MGEEPRYRKMRVMGTDAMVLSSKYSYLCFPLMSLFRSQYLLVDRKCRVYKEDKVMVHYFPDRFVRSWVETFSYHKFSSFWFVSSIRSSMSQTFLLLSWFDCNATKTLALPSVWLIISITSKHCYRWRIFPEIAIPLTNKKCYPILQ